MSPVSAPALIYLPRPRGEERGAAEERRRCSWNEHLGKTCRCIKCQSRASLWRRAKPGAAITSTTTTTMLLPLLLCLPLIKEKNNSDGGEDGPKRRYITCQLDEGRRQWGEMQTIWKAMWEATWPKGPTTLTSTLLARLDLFEVLHNALNITLFSFSTASSPLALLLSTLETTTTKTGRGPRQTQPRIKSIFEKLWCDYYSLTRRWQAAWDGHLRSVWRRRKDGCYVCSLKDATTDVTLTKVLHASFI